MTTISNITANIEFFLSNWLIMSESMNPIGKEISMDIVAYLIDEYNAWYISVGECVPPNAALHPLVVQEILPPFLIRNEDKINEINGNIIIISLIAVILVFVVKKLNAIWIILIGAGLGYLLSFI